MWNVWSRAFDGIPPPRLSNAETKEPRQKTVGLIGEEVSSAETRYNKGWTDKGNEKTPVPLPETVSSQKDPRPARVLASVSPTSNPSPDPYGLFPLNG